MTSSNVISQKEYLKKYLSGDVKKKKKKKVTAANIKRSVVVDDDIDLKSMRPLEDDEVELYHMDEDAPQIAGIVDERPPEVKAQEYYSSKRWKVFGGEDGVNIVDSKDHHNDGDVSRALKNRSIGEFESLINNKTPHQPNKKDTKTSTKMYKKESAEKNKYDKETVSIDKKYSKNVCNYSESDESSPRTEKGKTVSHKYDSDISPPRKQRHNRDSSDADASPPRSKSKYYKDSDDCLPRKDSSKKPQKHSSKYEERAKEKNRIRSHSNTPPRNQTEKQKYKYDSDNSPPRKRKNVSKQDDSDSDNSPPRKMDNYNTHRKYSPDRRKNQVYKKDKSDSDNSPPRRSDKNPNYKSYPRHRRRSFSDSDNSPPRRDRRISSKDQRKRLSRSRSPSEKINKSHRGTYMKRSRTGFVERDDKRHASDSDDSPHINRKTSKGSDSDLSPPRHKSLVNDRPLKKTLYKPNDSDEEASKLKNKKMKTTLDGKQAGLQDAKQLKKELSDLKMKEDTMFAKMDASVSGVGAAPVRRDRKTGLIRDLEKEKEAQKEKEAKESVVNEKYYKWGKGIKQTEDAAARAAEIMKEMNKPLARYVNDTDLDDFLKAQEREGDPMLEYIKKKQSESTPLQGEKAIYKGAWAPNRFNIRPGYRWDGVVRSNGYEQEWFKTKNAKKARDEEAYKWSTSDM